MKAPDLDLRGGVHFLTFYTYRHIPVFAEDSIRAIVAGELAAAHQASEFGLLAYVIMPNHIHLVLSGSREERTDAVVAQIKRETGPKAAEHLRHSDPELLAQLTVTRRGGKERFLLWQRNYFDQVCNSKEQIKMKIYHCHTNPVKRGLARRPHDWPWSSAATYRTKTASIQFIEVATRPQTEPEETLEP